MKNTKKLFIKTYGCQMNVYDSERMSEALGANGYEKTLRPDEADMILLNTCHIREKAAEKIYSELGRFKELKANKPDLKIGVTGCVAQAEGEEIIKRQPIVDLVVGPQSYQNIADLAANAGEGIKQIDIDFPKEDKFSVLKTARTTQRGPSAFLTVQEGCDKFCAFCVVPYTRGAESSRPVSRIIEEAKQLVDSGVREITLLGQNVNAYHGTGLDGNEWSLAKLIWELEKIDSLARIRFTTSHPNDMTPDLIEAHGLCKKLMPYLHLPVQSGSNKILKRMNRSHNAESYLSLISKIREASRVVNNAYYNARAAAAPPPAPGLIMTVPVVFASSPPPSTIACAAGESVDCGSLLVPPPVSLVSALPPPLIITVPVVLTRSAE
mgnify:CR=1 FL=1